MEIEKILYWAFVLFAISWFVYYVIQIKRYEKLLIESLPTESKIKRGEYFKDE